MRFFDTAGPMRPDDHYAISPQLPRQVRDRVVDMAWAAVLLWRMSA